MKLKIYVDTKKKRVVFAEAEKGFVDFIFHILSVPLGAVQRTLAKNTPSTSLGSLGTLQEGLSNLNGPSIKYDAQKYLLGIKTPYSGMNTTQLLPEASGWTTREEFIVDGYVNDGAMFMVMDDLVVRPADPTSVISVYESLIKDNVAVETREVTFSTPEAIQLLKASVTSKSVLTDVFLGAAIKAEKK